MPKPSMTRPALASPAVPGNRAARAAGALAAAVILSASHAPAQTGFVNWESPHVHPVDLTPDGTRLLAVNTADNRLEVFDVTTGTPVRTGSIPVGLEPVSVRARTSNEAWVVNRISDSVSIVNLSAMNTTATLPAGDEPSDVVFAQGRAFVSVTQYNQIHVFDPADLSLPPAVVTVEGEAPRALATDGTRVFAAIFESGNRTTIIPRNVVSGPLSPYGGMNPPPNSGTDFVPPKRPGNPNPPTVGLILKKMPDGTWRDDNNGNWSAAVTWDLHDHDVAILDATSLSLTYATGLMNLNMALAVRGSEVTVVGTDAINHIRFEPNLNGRFLRVVLGRFDAATPSVTSVIDLNPHLAPYTAANVPESTRTLSIGDPRAIVWNSAGTVGYIAGMGSNNILAIDAAGNRLGLASRDGSTDIGDGPTGIALDEPRNRAYVMCKFGGSIAVIDTTTLTQVGYYGFHDPTPAGIATGRHYLYNTHITSGTGMVACASCHVDGRMDQLVWDLGDPSGLVKPFNQSCSFGLGGCENWHPMKGPLATQTLMGIVGTEPLHWRGDRENLAAFNGAFVSIQGRDTPLEPGQIDALTDLVTSFTNPPNPYRNFDNTLKTSLQIPGSPNTGNPTQGLFIFQNNASDGGINTCVFCHALPTGTLPQIIVAGAIQEGQSMKIPHLRNMYFKTGFNKASMASNRGFGFSHDGSDASMIEFLQSPVFRFSNNPAVAAQQRRDLEAFMFSFPTETHPAVGTQTTVIDGAAVPSGQATLIADMLSLAQSGAAALVVKGRVGGLQRGFAYIPASSAFQPDRNNEPTIPPATLLALAAPGSELTYTVVPAGTQIRIGVDRDTDGFYDRTELDSCASPADPNDYPGSVANPDANADGAITPADIAVFINRWLEALGNQTLAADVNQDYVVNNADVAAFVNRWFAALYGACI